LGSNDPIIMNAVFEGNHFEAPALISPLLGDIGFSGIIVDNTSGFIIGNSAFDPNTFLRLENGIRISASPVLVQNCTFEDIYDFTDPFETFGYIDAGNCIFAEECSSLDVFNVDVVDANTGIYVLESSLNVGVNHFEDIVGGIRALFCDGKRINIFSNEIAGRGLGIHVGAGTPVSMDIFGNTIDLDQPNPFPNAGEWGIGVNQMDFLDAMGNPPPFPSTARIQENMITTNNVFRGIGIAGVKGLRVQRFGTVGRDSKGYPRSADIRSTLKSPTGQ
jgi:hypothetical protein